MKKYKIHFTAECEIESEGENEQEAIDNADIYADYWSVEKIHEIHEDEDESE